MSDSSKKRTKTSRFPILDDSHDEYRNLANFEARNRRSSRIEEHTKIFASMCPDEILDHYDDYDTRTYHTTLMLGDVSGFTDLAEKYTNSGKGGPSKLTETLNSYIGAMVQEILSHNGDVLKFSGDAFIVMWKVEDGTAMRDIAIEAMQTACIIQKHFGTHETDVGVTLKVKLAIASGKIYFTSIGDPQQNSHYIVTGKPVWEVKFAEALCRGGDILVAPSCWQWANPNEYVHETLPDGVHTLILASSIMWEDPKERYAEDNEVASDLDQISISQNSVSLFSKYSTGLPFNIAQKGGKRNTKQSNLFMQLDEGYNISNYPFKQIDYSLRPKVIKAAKDHLKNDLRSYMLRPVVRSVELDEPIEYLTEMRQVVIMFINVVTSSIGKKKLILLVNAAYKLVCGIVGEMQGCVNKTSLFDKDLMFLCIFGLRGDKHELESQIGLRCATKIRETLGSMKNVETVTVGVTSGITYCGVVGHILRREYTVIGVTVNKAARLMCAYNDKVICDRDSFLHSRLNARHFVLQEPKYLKGIKNVGPVYEFLEQAQLQGSRFLLNQYPLLGREKELKTFRKLLNDMRNVWKSRKSGRIANTTRNTLIIRGEPRMGKSRLLDDIVLNIPTEIPCNHITLIERDRQVPYTLIHLIFSLPLGFTATSSTPKEREDKIIHHLRRIRYPYYLCALNQAFNVNFNLTPRYQSLANNDKNKLLRKLIAKLAQACFRRLWVVVVDDAENSDPESLSLLATIVKMDRVLFVLSFGPNIDEESKLDRTIVENAEIIELIGIDKWFHAALACQILNVVAIPPELEKVLHERSIGNPGWIESYLISLIQTGGIVFQKMPIDKLRGMGLVMPPTAMILSTPTSEIDEIVKIDDDIISDCFDGWNMFKSSYGGSTSTAIEDSEEMLISRKRQKFIKKYDDKVVTICSIPKDFILEDVDSEITMDVMILKLFDSLTPLDQFLLKCASVLGETVNRNMLEKLMEGISLREIAFAVTKLFEIRILGCAAGDFIRSPGPIMFFRHVRNPNVDLEIRCGCNGFPVRETFSDLPKYASCGLMRFKMSMFRGTTYGLLTENQKVDFHTKALKYLRQNTRRCEPCGGGQFTRLLGKIHRENVKEQRNKIENLSYLMDLSDYGDILQPNPDIENETPPTATSISNINQHSCLSFRRSIVKSPTRTFSNVDFSNCQCNLILNTVYSQMLDHCRGIGRKNRTLTAIIEFVEVLLGVSNVPQARKLLQEAEVILEEMFPSDREDELIALPYLTSKVKTLQGRCYLESGFIVEAATTLEKAIKRLGYDFPRTRLMVRCRSKFLLEEQKLMLTWLRDWKIGVTEGDAANYNDQLAKCLAEMFNVFRIRGMHDHARLAAVWGLNAALASSKDFFTLCTSYANMITTAHNYRYRRILPLLENDAINICSERESTLELQELRAIAELYSSIFFSRWSRGQILKASSIGFVALKIARTVRSVKLKLTILPRLIHVLMMERRHDETISLLQELEFVSSTDVDKSGRTWYYALCIDFQLETGITLIPFKECEEYYQEKGETIINLRDPEAEKRYFTSMWLWNIRMGNWEAATVWKSKKIGARNVISEQTVAASITELKKLEGLLIYYVHKLDNRNAKAVQTTLVDIRKQFKIVENLQTVVVVILSRYVLMKAYYKMIRFRVKTGMKLLQRSKKLAAKMENRMIYEWADYCEKTWTNSINVIQQDLWKERCNRTSQIDWHKVNSSHLETVPFTLPLPDNYSH